LQFQQKLESFPTHLLHAGHFHQPPGVGVPHWEHTRARFFTFAPHSGFWQRTEKIPMVLAP
jgi:hypothetical protein